MFLKTQSTNWKSWSNGWLQPKEESCTLLSPFHSLLCACALLSSLSALTVIQPLHKHIPFTDLVENYPFTLNKKKISKSVKGSRNGREETATLSHEICLYLPLPQYSMLQYFPEHQWFFFVKIFFYKFLRRAGKLLPTESNAEFLFLTL